LKRVGPGLGEYIFDKEELDDWKENRNIDKRFVSRALVSFIR
jgi:hypothetical protein